MYPLSADEYDALARRYEPAARNLEAFLRALLTNAGIDGLFSNRFKTLRSLRGKLAKEKYQNINSLAGVVKEVKDLAGVRVAVYYPSDKWEVEALLYDCFSDVTQESHPTPKEKQSTSSAQRFEG